MLLTTVPSLCAWCNSARAIVHDEQGDPVEWPADLPLAHSWHDWQDVRALTIARMDQPWISFGGEQ